MLRQINWIAKIPKKEKDEMLALTEKEVKNVVPKSKEADSSKVKDFVASIIESSNFTGKEVSKDVLSINVGKLPMNEAELNWYCSMSREELEKIDRKR